MLKDSAGGFRTYKNRVEALFRRTEPDEAAALGDDHLHLRSPGVAIRSVALNDHPERLGWTRDPLERMIERFEPSLAHD